MSVIYEELFADRDSEYCDRILALCGLEGKAEYLEHESDLVRECFGYIEAGKSDSQCKYLLRDSQIKAELPVNNGNLSESELHQLIDRTLSEEELDKILDVVDLERKQGYSFQEADSFLESYEAFKSELESQFEESPTLTLIDLKQRAESDMSLSLILKLLPLCGLKEQDEYSEEQAEVFVECYKLHAEGKSAREITQHFGVVRETSSNQVEQTVINLAQLSDAQQEVIIERIANQVVSQQQQVSNAIERLVFTGVNEAIQDGTLNERIDRKIQENLSLGNGASIEAVVEVFMEQKEMLLPTQDSNKTLPQSSTN